MKKSFLEKLVSESNISQDDVVLEIGAGDGRLTKLIAESAKKVVAVEIDTTMIKKFEINILDFRRKVEVLNADFLTLDLSKFGRVKIVSNIPYDITSKILYKLTVERDSISEAFLTLQREAARKLVAKPGDKNYSMMSVFVRTFYEVELKFDIPPWGFQPKPKVFSSFVKLTPKSIRLGRGATELYADFLGKLFRSRRRKIKNILGISNEMANRRPDTLTCDEAFYIFRQLHNTTLFTTK